MLKEYLIVFAIILFGLVMLAVGFIVAGIKKIRITWDRPEEDDAEEEPETDLHERFKKYKVTLVNDDGPTFKTWEIQGGFYHDGNVLEGTLMDGKELILYTHNNDIIIEQVE